MSLEMSAGIYLLPSKQKSHQRLVDNVEGCYQNVTVAIEKDSSGTSLVFGKPTYIIYKPHRYICEDCDNNPTTTASPSWHSRGSNFTKDYESNVLLHTSTVRLLMFA